VPTVLIAAPAKLEVLKQRAEFTGALSFADNDALRAFDAIARQHAEVVVLESGFASTSRGAALMNRIKADPGMSGCDVRVITEETEPTSGPMAASASAPIVPAAPDPEATSHAGRDDDAATGTVAFEKVRGVELVVEGSPATLVELSVGGAQITSPTSLKPNQRVRLTLPGTPAVRLNGDITWAMFEMAAGGPRYRAGVAFVEPDVAGISRFIEGNRR
jgi:hypothetical protein